MGAGSSSNGLDAVQTHMTNTLNTPIESLEMNYPLRVNAYRIRHHSGGDGMHRGGDGLVREFEFLHPAQATILSERRSHAPWGLCEGQAGSVAKNSLNGNPLASKVSLQLEAGDRLCIETAGGGGWGMAKASS